MAWSDYKICDQCNNAKVFYDVDCANDQYLEAVDRGAIKAICTDCEKTHKIIIVPLDEIEGKK